MSRGDNILAEFRIIRSRCGLPTAEHVPSGVLLHSQIDPVAEARDFVAERATADSKATVLLGGGLGYIAEALAQAKGPEHVIHVIEPDIVLMQLAHRSRGDAPYFSLPGIKRISVVVPCVLTARIAEIMADAELIVSPYFERLAVHMRSPLAGFLQILRSERASRAAYDSILPLHRRANAERLESLVNALDVRLDPNKKIVVVGAGPSLDSCMAALHRYRHHILLAAASGAVPPLHAAGIVPDWVIALEGQDAIVKDLACLSPATAMIVFAATHPHVLRHARGAFYRGSDLESRGGTTTVPALDFALRCSSEDVFLVGMDLGNSGGKYAEGALRDGDMSEPLPNLQAKFIAMRAALENVLNRSNSGARKVYHVLADAPILKGARRLLPRELDSVLASKEIA